MLVYLRDQLMSRFLRVNELTTEKIKQARTMIRKPIEIKTLFATSPGPDIWNNKNTKMWSRSEPLSRTSENPAMILNLYQNCYNTEYSKTLGCRRARWSAWKSFVAGSNYWCWLWGTWQRSDTRWCVRRTCDRRSRRTRVRQQWWLSSGWWCRR